MQAKFIFVILACVTLFTVPNLKGSVTLAAPSGKTFVVNVTNDGTDKTPGNGICETGTGNGLCTLRAAIVEANAFLGDDTIRLPGEPMYLSIPGELEDSGAAGDLDITHNLTLKGKGASLSIIDGNRDTTHDRVLHVIGDIKVNISGVTIRKGKTQPYASGDFDGGGILNEGGTVTLSDSLVTDNYASLSGGGISNNGNLYLNRTTIHQDWAFDSNGGGIYNHPNASLTLTATTIHDNHANKGAGGGLHNNGSVAIYDSTISGNWSYGSGGGVSNYSGVLLVRGSTFDDNHAEGSGGGIANGSHSTLTMVNSTLSRNRAEHNGGGLANTDTYTDLTATLLDVTVSENEANLYQQHDGKGGGIYVHPGSIVTLRNTIIAGNLVRPGGLAPKPHDCSGTLVTGGYNLLGRDSGCTGLVNGANGDQVGTHLFPVYAELAALTDNGGPTRTYALKANSPAVDAGNPGGCTDEATNALVQDQRGFMRPAGTVCDMGAFEYDSIPPAECAGKPTVPTLLTPDDNAGTTDLRVKLDWSGEDCVTTYRVRVNRDIKKGPNADKKVTTKSKYKTKSLETGRTYYWRVKACNSFGCSKTPFRAFKIN